jgi:signal transduction histidine kinase
MAILGSAVVGLLVALGIVSLLIPYLLAEHMQLAGINDEMVNMHVLEALKSALLATILIVIAVTFIVSLILSIVIARRVSRSISGFEVSMNAVRNGDYSVKVPHIGVAKEFDDLADMFNLMALSLNETEATRRRIVADLAHELRTPITVISGYLEAFIDGVSVPDLETLALLQAQTKRLETLASDMSLVSKAEDGGLALNKRPVLISELITDAYTQHIAQFRDKNVALIFENLLGGDEAYIAVDSDRILQVLGNILNNALRHTPENGEVKMTLSASRTEVHIAITDTGDGISSQDLDHIFERFYRADLARDRDSGGSGIGLSIVRGIVRAHGGSITATSEGLGCGAQFEVTLPWELHCHAEQWEEGRENT